MIVFDLRCGRGHVFEAWFGSTDDYESQRARTLVACPICDDRAVEKAVMAPAVPAKSNRRPAAPRSPAEVKAMLAAMAKMQAAVEANSDYVGTEFASEARAIHLGEADARSIYGEATVADAVALREEGIEVAPLPFQRRRAADA